RVVPHYRYRTLIQLAIVLNESVNKKGIRMDALFSFYFSFCAIYIYDIYVNVPVSITRDMPYREH
ncbi:MAG: hypothetical protein ACRDBJ_02560, partial [Plesiomonas shigelloides]